MLVVSSVGTQTPPPQYGGLEVIAFQDAALAAKAGHEVHLVVSLDSDLQRIKDAGVHPVPTVPSGITGGIPEKESWQVWSNKVKMADFDLIHDHSHQQHTLLAQIELAKRKTKQGAVCRTIHDDRPFSQLPWIEGMNFISPTAVHGDRMTEAYGIVTRTCWHGVDAELYPVREAAPNSKQPFVFVGRISPIKGVHVLVDIFKRLKLPLVLVGPGDHLGDSDPYVWSIKSMVKDDPLIDYKGEVSHQEKVHLLQNCQAAVFASRFHEPFGLMVAEAQMCGTPVLSLDMGGPRETVRGFDSRLASDPYELLRVVEEHARRVQEGVVTMEGCERTRERTIKDFSLEAHWRSLEQLYLDAVNTQGW